MQTQEQVNQVGLAPCLLQIDLVTDTVKVVGIMRNNVEKVLERDQKLGDLEDKSGTV